MLQYIIDYVLKHNGFHCETTHQNITQTECNGLTINTKSIITKVSIDYLNLFIPALLQHANF